jgi:hypothetical protein
MTTDFRAALKGLGLSGRGFAALTGITPNTVSNWGRQPHGRDVQDVPLWAWRLIDAWRATPSVLADALRNRNAAE